MLYQLSYTGEKRKARIVPEPGTPRTLENSGRRAAGSLADTTPADAHDDVDAGLLGPRR